MRIPLSRLTLLLLPAIVATLLAACGSGDRDETVPVLTIDSRIDSPRIEPAVTLSGTNEPGASVDVTQTSSLVSGRIIDLADPSAPTGGTWTSTSITLDPGSNVIAVTATDKAGNSRIIKMTLVLADVILGTDATASGIPPATVVRAQFRKPVPDLPIGSFQLYRADDAAATPVPATVTRVSLREATLDPSEDLFPSTSYRAVISPASAKVKDDTGVELPETFLLFTTAAQ